METMAVVLVEAMGVGTMVTGVVMVKMVEIVMGRDCFFLCIYYSGTVMQRSNTSFLHFPWEPGFTHEDGA